MQFGRTGFGFLNTEVLYNKLGFSNLLPYLLPNTPFSERIEII